MQHNYIRPEIMVFAAEMERKMRLNDASKGDMYKTTSPRVLHGGLVADVRELDAEIDIFVYGRATPRVAYAAFAESADVANMAMMISWVLLNNAGCYPVPEERPVTLADFVNPRLPDPPEPLYYLQYAKQWVGNDMLWWRQSGNGYTTDLRLAETYTAEQVTKHIREGVDRPWLKHYIDTKTRPAVDMQYVKKAESPWP